MPTESPLGAALVHQYYPGFIDLPASSQYLVISDDLQGAVDVVSHVRPLIVTDFDNGFVRTSFGEQTFTRLRKPLHDVDDACLVVDATGREGRKAPMIVVEKDKAGRVFYQGMYTEILTCAEFWSDEHAQDLGSHGKLIERFIGAYRYLHPDVRVPIAGDIPIETTPLRIGYYRYSPTERTWPFEQRIQQAWPQELQLSIIAYGQAAAALRDHAGNEVETLKRGERVNSYLCNGFRLPENLIEIERLADLATTTRRPRAAVIEAVSILEVGLLQARDRLTSAQRGTHSLRKHPDEITLKFLVEKMLPALLSFYDGDVGWLIERAKAAREIRNRCVHHGHVPSMEEAGAVLTIVRTLLSIFETDDGFKGNYKLKTSGA